MPFTCSCIKKLEPNVDPSKLVALRNELSEITSQAENLQNEIIPGVTMEGNVLQQVSSLKARLDKFQKSLTDK